MRECKETGIYSTLNGVIQHIYVYTDHVKANYSHKNCIVYNHREGNPGPLEMEPEKTLRKSINSISTIKLSLPLIVYFVIMRYKGMETNPYACLTGTPALYLEVRS